jgi:hypothetical protein
MNKLITAIATATLLSACGGGGSSDTGDAGVTDTNTRGEDTRDSVTPGTEPGLTALFKDTATEGLDYQVKDYSGRTDEKGAFKYYSEDDIITFSVGGVVLGSAKVQDVLTPIDLFEDGSSDQLQVQNIVRFLLALDEDGDPSNGIKIPTSVAQQAVEWEPLNWNDSDFSNTVLNTIDTDLEIPTNNEARAHIESTYNCMYAGLWLGEYGGSDIDQGRFYSFIDASTGQSSSAAHSSIYPAAKLASSTQPMSYRNSVLLVSGSVSTGSVLSAEFPTITEATGTWQLGYNEPGTLYSNRFNKDLTYQNRITAILRGNEPGYSQDTKYHVSIDVKDSGEYNAAVYAFNEEMSEGRVTSRVADSYLAQGKLEANQAEIALTGTNRKIVVTTDFATNTVALKTEPDVTVDTISGGYCKLL